MALQRYTALKNGQLTEVINFVTRLMTIGNIDDHIDE